MQKCFIIRNGEKKVREEDLNKVNTFIGNRGHVINVTASRPIDINVEFGSWLIVVDNGNGENPLD